MAKYSQLFSLAGKVEQQLCERGQLIKAKEIIFLDKRYAIL